MQWRNVAFQVVQTASTQHTRVKTNTSQGQRKQFKMVQPSAR